MNGKIAKEQLVRSTVIALVTGVILAGGILLDQRSGKIAASEVKTHDRSTGSHDSSMSKLAMVVDQNKGDITVLTERTSQRDDQLMMIQERQEQRLIRMEDKLDRIIEKL